MPQIEGLIASQAFERIRDRIGEILADEIANQAELDEEHGSDIEATVYIERSAAFGHTELPAVNVMLARGQYGGDGGDNAITSDGTYNYNIDCYCLSKSKVIDGETNQGDQLASVKLHRLLGVVRAILRNARYKTLGFATPYIMQVKVGDIQLSDQLNINDTLNVMMGRLTLIVRVAENHELIEPSLIAGYDTQVKLGLTDKGYVFSGAGSPAPQPSYGGEVFLNDISFGIVEVNDSLNITVVNTNNEPVGEKIGDAWVVPVGGDSEIDLTINNSIFSTLTESPSNVVVENTVLTQVGSKVGNNWRVTDSTAIVKNSAGTTIATENIPAEVSEEIVIADTIATAKNSANTTLATATQVAGVATTVTVLDITVTDSDESTYSHPAGENVVCTPQIKSLTSNFYFEATDDLSPLITIVTATAGTYTAIADDGASGTITVDIDGAGFGAFVNPTTLTVGQTFQVKRTITTAAGSVTLTGTYV